MTVPEAAVAVLARTAKPLANLPARLSVLVGLVAVCVIPAGVAASRYVRGVSLLDAVPAVPVGAALGIGALLLARRGRRLHERTLGRIGGDGVARAGRLLGLVGLCLAITGAIALAVFGLATLLAR